MESIENRIMKFFIPEKIKFDSSIKNIKNGCSTTNITLYINTDIQIDVLHIIEIPNNINKKLYLWKNNFSIEFLDKIFSLDKKLSYSVLYFYYLLIEYNKNEDREDTLFLHEYIYFIINSNFNIINYSFNVKNKNNLKLEFILKSITRKNILSIDFLKKTKSEFDVYYSYDYFIETSEIYFQSISFYNNLKKNVEGLTMRDFTRDRNEYFFDNINYFDEDEKIYKEIFFSKIKELVSKFIDDNKCVGQSFDDIYIKVLNYLNQRLGIFVRIYITNIIDNFKNIFPNKEIYINYVNNVIDKNNEYKIFKFYNKDKIFRYFNINYIDNNIIIKFYSYFTYSFFDDRRNIFLEIKVSVEIDILNNKISFKYSFEWKNEKIREIFLKKLILLDSTVLQLNIKKHPNFKLKKMMIINFDEGNKEYNKYNYDKHISYIKENIPLFILVSTQNSTTKFIEGKSVSFQHILKDELEELNYSYMINDKRIKDYDYGLKKISGKPVDRLRLYKFNIDKKNILTINNVGIDFSNVDIDINNVGIDIIQKKFLSNGTLCIKLKYRYNIFIYKYIFLNINLKQDANLNQEQNNIKTFKYIFDLLTTENNFFKDNNRKSKNLIDLFIEGYNIYFLGNIDLNFLRNIIGNVIKKNKNGQYFINSNNNDQTKFYLELHNFIDEYFNKKDNSIINKKKIINIDKKNNLIKPSIISSKKEKNNYQNKYNKIKKNIKIKYRSNIFDFFINTTIKGDGDNIFYTSLNKSGNNIE